MAIVEDAVFHGRGGNGALGRVYQLGYRVDAVSGAKAVKRLGLIGGIGPESTVEYYRFLIEEYRARVPDGSYPPLVIDSIDLTRLVRLMEARDLASVTDVLTAEVRRLVDAGAELAALAANTPHIVFDAVRERSPVPMVSIVEATGEAARAMKLQRVGLFGTRFTMQAPFYPAVFARRGLTVVMPPPADQDYIHEKYMGELVAGRLVPETRERLLAIAEDLRRREGVEAIILGGTELPLLLRDAPEAPVPFLDTTRLHVKAIVAEMLRHAG
jgi:aspartate racemase